MNRKMLNCPIPKEKLWDKRNRKYTGKYIARNTLWNCSWAFFLGQSNLSCRKLRRWLSYLKPSGRQKGPFLQRPGACKQLWKPGILTWLICVTQVFQHKFFIVVFSLIILVRAKYFILRSKQNIQLRLYTLLVLIYFHNKHVLRGTGKDFVFLIKTFLCFFLIKHNCPLFKVCLCMVHIF